MNAINHYICVDLLQPINRTFFPLVRLQILKQILNIFISFFTRPRLERCHFVHSQDQDTEIVSDRIRVKKNNTSRGPTLHLTRWPSRQTKYFNSTPNTADAGIQDRDPSGCSWFSALHIDIWLRQDSSSLFKNRTQNMRTSLGCWAISHVHSSNESWDHHALLLRRVGALFLPNPTTAAYTQQNHVNNNDQINPKKH